MESLQDRGFGLQPMYPYVHTDCAVVMLYLYIKCNRINSQIIVHHIEKQVLTINMSCSGLKNYAKNLV